MIFPKNITSATRTLTNLVRITQKDHLQKQMFSLVCLNQMKLFHNQIFYFSDYNKNTVPPSSSAENPNELNEIKDKIESMYLKLNEN